MLEYENKLQRDIVSRFRIFNDLTKYNIVPPENNKFFQEAVLSIVKENTAKLTNLKQLSFSETDRQSAQKILNEIRTLALHL